LKTAKILKSGYTTGSHATSALKAALFALFTGNTEFNSVSINLPEGDDVEFDIENIEKSENYVQVSVIKSDNDDIDVTKGCKIICHAGYKDISYLKQEIDHQPHCLQLDIGRLFIYAGKGHGIVTKKGLDAPVGFSAINPVPLTMMREAANQVFKELNIKEKEIFIVFEVENGEEIAKNTANAKAGILGGISFIGKTGIVKPISVDAYLDSLAAEINVAGQNGIKNIVFTMGNSSLKLAQNNYKPENDYIVEIGNFVFDSLKLLAGHGFNRVVIVTNTGKLTKIAQEKKNTNNRYGDIDFNMVKSWLENGDFPNVITEICDDITIIGSLEKTIIAEYPEYLDKFYQIIINNALIELKKWADELALRDLLIEIILTDGEKVKYQMNNREC